MAKPESQGVFLLRAGLFLTLPFSCPTLYFNKAT